MATLVKPWGDGGSLSVTYIGDGDGSAVFTTDANEGIDREMVVTFRGAGQEIERTVKQEGRREIFNDEFVLADGGTFNVLKGEAPYTRCVYLESEGKQWIDTGIEFDSAKDIVLSAEAESLSTGRSVIMGSYYSATNRAIAIEFGGSSNNQVGAGRGYVLMKQNGALSIWSEKSEINVKRSISLSFTASTRKAVLTFDGVETTGTANSGTLAPNSSILMFLDARPLNASAIQYPLRIYSARIVQDGELVRDFIPVIDKEGVACMYDKVGKVFYYNKGTGTFTAV